MIDVIKRLSKERKEPSWILTERIKSWQNFLKLEMPKGDEWKYKDLSKLDFSSINFGKSKIKIKAENAEEIDEFRECFFEEDKFDALNNALFTEAAAFRLNDGRIRIDVDVKDWFFAKLLLVTDGNTKIEERIKGRGNAFLCCKVIAKGRVNYTYLQLTEKGFVYNHKNILLVQDSASTFEFFEAGGDVSRLKIGVEVGKNSSSIIKGGYLGIKDQHFNIVTNVVHKEKYGESTVLIKGVMKDKASSTCFGSIAIEKNAQKSNSSLSGHMLLIDEGQANVIPSLKIDANDVSAKHAATVSQPNEEQLFYLMSRGIERKMAESMIIKAFFEEIKEINKEEIKRIIEEKLL